MHQGGSVQPGGTAERAVAIGAQPGTVSVRTAPPARSKASWIPLVDAATGSPMVPDSLMGSARSRSRPARIYPT